MKEAEQDDLNRSIRWLMYNSPTNLSAYFKLYKIEVLRIDDIDGTVDVFLRFPKVKK